MLVEIEQLDLWGFESLNFLVPFVAEELRDAPEQDE